MKFFKNENRSFGFIFFLIFISLALYNWIYKDKFINYLFVISITLFLLSIFIPKVLFPLRKMWIGFGNILSKFIPYIVMFLIYFTIVLLTKLVIVVSRKDILNLKNDQKVKSYWIERSNLTDMNNQF